MSEVKTNKISSLASNNDITIDPDGTGDTIIASGNVGIGNASPPEMLSVGDTSDANVRLRLTSSTSGAGTIQFGDGTGASGYRGYINYTHSDDALAFATSATERMRIDSSGNVLIGKTVQSIGTDGVTIVNGQITATADGANALRLNRKTSDGDIVSLRKDGTQTGSIGTAGSGTEIYFTASGTNGTGLYMSNSATVVPMKGGSVSDNTVDCGHPSYRFDDIRATNGTIQTSDQNDKQQIASLTTAEITAAKAISALFKTFKWNDKVEAKGDDARTHTGVIAQEVQTAMSNAGLDAADYAFWCSDTWTDDDGNSQTRMGIRYPELLAFVGAATEQRLADIETRLTALEAELMALGKIKADTLEHSTAGSLDTQYVVNGSAKAWLNLNGTGTIAIRDSFNVSGVSDGGTGNYTTSFTTSFSNANYSHSHTNITNDGQFGLTSDSILIAQATGSSTTTDTQICGLEILVKTGLS